MSAPSRPAAPMPCWNVRLSHAVGDERRRFTLELDLRTAARRLVLAGPSGAGKTLTLLAVAGLLAPRDGRIAIDGETLLDTPSGISLPARDRRCGVMFQDYALFPHLTVRQNVAFGRHRGWRNPRERDDGDPRVAEVLDRLELAAVAHQRPHELSGGQRQRTALARALVIQPRALLLDEPFAALDPALRGRLRDDLDQVLREQDLPLLMISHDPADLERFGQAVARIEEGRVASWEEVAA